MRKAVEFSPTSATPGRFFRAVASIRVRLMCNLSLKKMRLLFECGFYTRLYGIQSLLAAGAVWLNLDPPPQPEGCRGRPRCSQTAPATRKDCVYHDGTKNSTRTGKPRRNRTQRETFWTRKKAETFTQASAMWDCKYQPWGRNLQYRMARISLSVLAEQVPVQRSRGDGRNSQCSSVNLIGLCHGYRHVTFDSMHSSLSWKPIHTQRNKHTPVT